MGQVAVAGERKIIVDEVVRHRTPHRGAARQAARAVPAALAREGIDGTPREAEVVEGVGGQGMEETTGKLSKRTWIKACSVCS